MHRRPATTMMMHPCQNSSSSSGYCRPSEPQHLSLKSQAANKPFRAPPVADVIECHLEPTTPQSPSQSVTYLAKVLTFILIGFAGGLSYHLYCANSSSVAADQWLQGTDNIVKQLMTENQLHQHQIDTLRQEVSRVNDTAQRLRRHASLEGFVQEAHTHEHDPHALLWSDQVHEARLLDAHQQAEALLQRMHSTHEPL
jgi:hypothetical protein